MSVHALFALLNNHLQAGSRIELKYIRGLGRLYLFFRVSIFHTGYYSVPRLDEGPLLTCHFMTDHRSNFLS